MNPLNIGDRQLAITRPADLDTQLLATTGCNAAEHAAMLKAVATPYGVARALRPLLGEDAPALGDLADMIAADDVGAIGSKVAALLVPVSEGAQNA